MEIVKAFNQNELHTEIVIKGTSENPLFRASDIGNVLEITNIRTTINDFNTTEKVVHTMDTLGGSQQVTFLTEKGLYKVLFKSRKPIAEKFQNWVCEVIKEIRLHGIYDLQKQLEQQKDEIKLIEDKKKKEYEDKLSKQKILEREKILLKEYATSGAIFYVIKVKSFENGQYIVKIGESRIGITNRYKEHKSNYPECLLLDCFAVSKSKDFETFIKDHELIKDSRVNDLPSHESELELFLIGKKLSYQTFLGIVNNNLKYFNQNDTHKLELENEQLKLKLEMQNVNSENNIAQELLNIVKQLSFKIDKLEKSNKEVLEKLNASQTKLTTGFQQPLTTLGPRLQKINPETLELIKVYECVTEAMKENSSIKRPSINKAIVENTVYNGFRWLLVDRDLDPNIIHNIEPTKQTITKQSGYIAKLTCDKTTILNVYLDRKTASHFNGYESSSALVNPVKNFTLAKGFYYMLYDYCDPILKESFQTKYGEPILYKNGVGQYDIQNNLVKEFVCKYDCIKKLSISDKTLEKAIDKNIQYNGYFYKSLGSKLQFLQD
jgi:prophage antirepressor-like protein